MRRSNQDNVLRSVYYMRPDSVLWAEPVQKQCVECSILERIPRRSPRCRTRKDVNHSHRYIAVKADREENDARKERLLYVSYRLSDRDTTTHFGSRSSSSREDWPPQPLLGRMSSLRGSSVSSRRQRPFAELAAGASPCSRALSSRRDVGLARV